MRHSLFVGVADVCKAMHIHPCKVCNLRSVLTSNAGCMHAWDGMGIACMRARDGMDVACMLRADAPKLSPHEKMQESMREAQAKMLKVRYIACLHVHHSSMSSFTFAPVMS